MVNIPSPGEYILLRRAGRPDWPAVICTDDMAPTELQRPNGYLTLVLLIDTVLDFYYAASTEMQAYVPVGGHPDKELQAAHDRVLDQMESPRSSLDHWKLETEEQRIFDFLPTPSPSTDYKFTEESDDEEIKIAKHLSLLDWETSNENRPLTASSPPKGAKISRAIPQFFDSHASDLRRHFRPIGKANMASLTESVSSRQSLTELDYIEGDLSKSRGMVKIYVGEEGEEFLIPRSEIDRLPHLSDAKIGCIATMDDGTSRLDLACLREFNPADFGFVAQFLSTGQFGHSVINEQNREEAFAECVAAWQIADRMVIEDLLDHIVVKVQQAQPWQLEELWYLARLVYETIGTPLPAYKIIKDILADSIADKYHEMLRQLGEEFIGPLYNLPELERDLYQKLVGKADQRLQ